MTTPKRAPDIDDDDDVDLNLREAPAPPPTAKRIPLRLNRNLMNYPLARSARTPTRWEKIGDDWVATLPGDDRIELYLTKETPEKERRAPTGFDMNVLKRILAEVQRPGRDEHDLKVEFGSLTALLRELGFTGTGKNNTWRRTQLKSALALWEDLAIRWCGCWYRHQHWKDGAWKSHGGQRGKRGTTQELPPPLRRVTYKGNRLVITLDPTWVALFRDTYTAPLPLPLPNDAAVQNCILMVLTSDFIDEEERVARRHWHWMRPFLRKMGLRCELTKLRSVVARADEWLKRHEGFLGLMLPSETMLNIPRGKITFLVGIPTIPRWPKGEKSSWSKGN